MRLGIFGGTFDPIHNGHLAIAKAAMQEVQLDKLYVFPTANPPHKGRPCSSLAERYAMVTLALQGERNMIPYMIPDSKYAVDEIKHFMDTFGVTQVFYIMGMDSYLDIPNWYRPDELCQLCHFVVSYRPGFSELSKVPETPLFNQAMNETTFFKQIQLPIAARDVRAAIHTGDISANYLLPTPVMHYIEKTGLYDGTSRR